MLTGLSGSVASPKTGNTEENKVSQDAASCPFNRGSPKASLLNLKAPIHSGRVLSGPQIPSENKCAELQDHMPFRNCVLALYLLFCKAQSLAQQEAERYQVTGSLFHEAQTVSSMYCWVTV